MKPSFVFAIVMLTAIVMISSFDLQFAPGEIVPLPDNIDLGQVLYVCPAASQTWDSVAEAMRPFHRAVTIGFFFAAMILMFVWGWALYQNLLKDKFDRKSFTNPWGFTKLWLWALVIVVTILATPNYFRTVHVRGISTEYVLCDNNTPGNQPVRYEAVSR